MTNISKEMAAIREAINNDDVKAFEKVLDGCKHPINLAEKHPGMAPITNEMAFVNENGTNIFCYALGQGSTAIVECIIRRGADVNEKMGFTPLELALISLKGAKSPPPGLDLGGRSQDECLQRYSDILITLLKAGAKPTTSGTDIFDPAQELMLGLEDLGVDMAALIEEFGEEQANLAAEQLGLSHPSTGKSAQEKDIAEFKQDHRNLAALHAFKRGKSAARKEGAEPSGSIIDILPKDIVIEIAKFVTPYHSKEGPKPGPKK